MANSERKNSAVPGPRLPAMKFEAKVLCVACLLSLPRKLLVSGPVGRVCRVPKLTHKRHVVVVYPKVPNSMTDRDMTRLTLSSEQLMRRKTVSLIFSVA